MLVFCYLHIFKLKRVKDFLFRIEEGNFEERAFLGEASPEDGADPESFGKIKDLGIQVLKRLEAVTDDLLQR
jgi:hypothetical protein